MMKHFLRRYTGNTQFEADYNGENYEEPWVSVTDGDASGRVNYNKSEREKLLGTPLTFKITGGGDIKWKANDASSTKEIQYSKNGGEWTSVTSTTAGETISVAANDVVKFKSSVFPQNNSFSGTTAGFKLEGNVMSLGGGDDFASLTEITQASAFTGLFRSCTGLTHANKLMLPATTLAQYCYYRMFYGCTNLTTVPELPATTLADNCYNQMFEGCTSLTTAPALPATTLAQYCYYRMFYGCGSLTTAPELPATTLVQSCYSQMFQGCTSLTTAPELPATTLVQGCYESIFQDCTSLTTAPALPATTLTVSNCYSNMFRGCTSLTTAPTLPATALTSYCYSNMFNGCRSLTTAPELPATTLKTGCYGSMFQSCTNLNYIKAMFTISPSTTYTSNWVYGVAATGTFVKNSAASWDVTGVNGIPSGWTVETA